MLKKMQNVILIIDQSGNDWSTPLKSGNSFMNRFSIDEDAAFEIIGIYHLDTELSSILAEQRFYMEEDRKGRGREKSLLSFNTIATQLRLNSN